MKLQLTRHQEQRDRGHWFLVHYRVVLSGEEQIAALAYGLPALTKLREQYGRPPPPDVYALVRTSDEPAFGTVEEALTFESALRAACRADLWHLRESAHFGQDHRTEEDEIEPHPYPSDSASGTGTNTTASDRGVP